MQDKLSEARRIINEVDAQMAELFVRRMQAVRTVQEHKMEFGLPVLDKERENEVIIKNSALVKDEELKEYYIEYIRQVMRISRAYQHRLQNGLRVAYSGIEGAFAHIASGKIFPTCERVSCGDFKEAYNAVVNGECDVAVLPIENSYAGEVGQTVDLIFSGELYINGIYELRVQQNLLGLPEASIDDIKSVISHSQALAQCYDYISAHGIEGIEVSNTAVGARQVSEMGDKTCGAIAGVETAKLYGLKVLESNINKSSENTTRFAVLSQVRASSPSLKSTVLMFTVSHEAGSLANAIGIIGGYGYNMTALRSRPMKSSLWQYYFYVEIDGAIENETGRAMLAELKKVCDKLKVAGTFAPHAEI